MQDLIQQQPKLAVFIVIMISLTTLQVDGQLNIIMIRKIYQAVLGPHGHP